jgi:hypothetical protein
VTPTGQPSLELAVTAPPTLRRWRQLSLLVALVGLALAVAGAFLDRTQFWHSYLLAYVFWLEIALGCLGWLMLHHLVGGRWGHAIRPLLMTGAATLPLMLLLFLPLLLGLASLYPWTAAHAPGTAVEAKTIYLNVPFFLGRAALYFAVWLGLARLLNRWSRAGVDDPDRAKRLRRLSAGGMILYMLTATFAGYDWLMSLEPEWFSSIYGLLWIAGQGLAALAVAIIGLRYMTWEAAPRPAEAGVYNDLGNFMLALVMIWAYFAFSQFLIIWSANLPEEAIWMPTAARAAGCRWARP